MWEKALSISNVFSLLAIFFVLFPSAAAHPQNFLDAGAETLEPHNDFASNVPANTLAFCRRGNWVISASPLHGSSGSSKFSPRTAQNGPQGIGAPFQSGSKARTAGTFTVPLSTAVVAPVLSETPTAPLQPRDSSPPDSQSSPSLRQPFGTIPLGETSIPDQ